jgi:NADH:ubiquinone oxidoreductase subunit E
MKMAVQHKNEALDLDAVIEHNRQGIIAMLYAIQQHYRYLPEDVLRELSQKIDKPSLKYTASPLSTNCFR